MVGDGSYLMMNSEIATSVMLGLKLTIVLLDNGGFGCINRLQQATGGAAFNNLVAARRRSSRPCRKPRRDGRERRRPGGTGSSRAPRAHRAAHHGHRRSTTDPAISTAGRRALVGCRRARSVDAAEVQRGTRRLRNSDRGAGMARMTVRLGTNPIGWSNDDLRELGGATPLETCLAEARQAGFAGIELGHKFPREPDGVAARCWQRHGLALVSGWYSASLLQRDGRRRIARHAPASVDCCADLGLQRADPRRDLQRDPWRPDRAVVRAARCWPMRDWHQFAARLTDARRRWRADRD